MSSIVLELQQDALSHTGSVLGLLRKTILVASKLSIKEVLAWAKSETEGYKTQAPDYRVFVGQLKTKNPYHGWQEVLFQGLSAQIEETVGTVRIDSPVSQIESWMSDPGGDTIAFPLPSSALQLLGIDLPGARFISKSALSIIPDRVRGFVLDWSIELEQKGILGEGMTFTPQEKAQASHVTTNYFFAPQYQNNGQAGAMGDAAAAEGLVQRMSSLFKRNS